MKSIDYAKAAGIAVALLVVNVLVAILVVTFYAYAVEPGQSREFYEQAAQRIAPWCSHIAGTALFFVALWYLTARKPDRNPYLFAAVVSVLYAFIDAASVGFAGIVEMEFILSMSGKLMAALAGAFVGARVAAEPETPLDS